MSVHGRCYCGAVRFELRFPTDSCSLCHCEDCRKSHGTAFVTWASVRRSRFELVSGREHLRKYESHPGVRWGFCGLCGASFLYDCDETPDLVYVTVGNLDGPLDREPDGHVSFEEHVRWLEVADGLPRYRGKREEAL
jgi:hypothetical protein